MATPKKIGGEYGEIRAGIDIANLNAYLASHVKAVHGPIEVKQFKVMHISSSTLYPTHSRVVWAGMSRWHFKPDYEIRTLLVKQNNFFYLTFIHPLFVGQKICIINRHE